MLVVFEGLHSAGKSTQVAALAGALQHRGVTVVTTEWNSSPPLGRRISQLKIDNRLGPTAMVLMEAADLAYRFESQLRDALAGGAVVVSDRYFYSTLVRGIARGIDAGFIRSCFAFAPEPGVVFHLRCAADVTLARREAVGLSIGGHMSGEDHRVVTDRRKGFVSHQSEMGDLYDDVLPDGTVRLDATAPAADLHAKVVAAVTARMPRVRTVP
jgi:dTMP kinase